MRQLLLGCVAALALAVATVASAGTTKERFTFYSGFNIGGLCDGSGIVGRAFPNPDFGYVTFSVKDGTISAVIKVKSGFSAPEYYNVRLIQGPNDCHTGFTRFELEDGTAKITISEPVTSDFAFLHIDQHDRDGIANSSLVTETFRHSAT
jgi:hypothetical protein